MNQNELEEFLSAMEHVGLKPIIITVEEDNEELEMREYKDPEDFLGEYVGNAGTLRTITISKADFNKACDTIVYNNDFSFEQIITLARFTAEVRYLLFDKDKKTEKEEKKNV